MVSEELADHGQVLPGHDGIADHGVAEVVTARPADAGGGADGLAAV